MNDRNELHRELAARAAAGCTESRNELLLMLLPLVRFKAKKFARNRSIGLGPEDYEQSAMVSLLEALHKYRPGRGASVATFAASVMVNSMLGVSRKEARHNLHRETDECDVEFAPARPERMTDQERAMVLDAADAAGVELVEVHTSIQPTTPAAKQAAMRRLRANGLSYRNIASRLGSTTFTVRNCIAPPERLPRRQWRLTQDGRTRLRQSLAALATEANAPTEYTLGRYKAPRPIPRGSIYRRPNGAYQASLGWNRIRYERLFPTQAKARQWLDELRAALDVRRTVLFHPADARLLGDPPTLVFRRRKADSPTLAVAVA
jgi:RNA polymerase sigma factor (sigma-70 family)